MEPLRLLLLGIDLDLLQFTSNIKCFYAALSITRIYVTASLVSVLQIKR
jgi:hypothetical protein